MKREKPKMYIVRKYIMAPNALSAIRKDKTTKVHDVWIDSDWKENNARQLTDAIGYHVLPTETDDDEV